MISFGLAIPLVTMHRENLAEKLVDSSSDCCDRWVKFPEDAGQVEEAVVVKKKHRLGGKN